MDQLLEKLFESVPKVSIMRLFVQNPQNDFTLSNISDRTKIKRRSVQTELVKLVNVGLIKKKIITIPDKNNKAKKANGYGIDTNFPLLQELRDLIIRSSTASRKRLFIQVKRLGKVKLVVLSGIFINSDRSRTDILIVGDDISKRKLENFLSTVESELGKTVSYTLMETDEFKYRIGMFDRFLRDIFEYPHEKLLNKLNLPR